MLYKIYKITHVRSERNENKSQKKIVLWYLENWRIELESSIIRLKYSIKRNSDGKSVKFARINVKQ